MPGNSKRRGAVRAADRPQRTVGSGGQRRRGLAGKGPTPPAAERVGHPAARRAARTAGTTRRPRPATTEDEALHIGGHHAVSEALQAGVPCRALHVLAGGAPDGRLRAVLDLAGERGCPVHSESRATLDGLCPGQVHQGVVLVVPPFEYRTLAEVLPVAGQSTASLFIALDGITDPHNLGAMARSAAAFGADALLLPGRRSAQVTPGAWKASAGAFARLPVARVPNLTGALRRLGTAGMFSCALLTRGGTPLDAVDRDLLRAPLVLVIGSESAGVSRLVAATCDTTLSIPVSSRVESLNASVAAGITLQWIAHVRGAAPRRGRDF